MTVLNRVPVPDEIRADLNVLKISIEDRILNGDVPQYPGLVLNLMKGCDKLTDDLAHSGMGLAGEAGEVLDLIKKVWAYGKPLDLAKMIEELGDLRFYYQSILNLLGVTDREIIAYNMNKLLTRYPTGQYSDAQAIARADKQPQAAPAPAPAPAPAAPLPMGGRKFIGQTRPAPQANAQLNPLPDDGLSPYMRQVVAKAEKQNAEGNEPKPMTEAEADRANNAGESPTEVNQ